MTPVQDASICFLILHYMNFELTCKTIDSVLNLKSFGNSQIIVVDNASPNRSGESLEKKYGNTEQIHIILSESNLGFSAGNNLGFQYIKKNYISDFVVVINNDILFPQKDFIIELYALYEKYSFWVAGPDIYVPQKNYHSSPMYDHILNEQEIRTLFLEKNEREQKQLEKRISVPELRLYIRDCFGEKWFVKAVAKIIRILKGQTIAYQDRQSGVVLQGSCLIFDKRYCQQNDDLFMPLTFMYAEEEILTLQCKKNNWEIRYFPELQVWHTCDGSSQLYGLSYKEYCKKRMEKLNRGQLAYLAYIELLNRCDIKRSSDETTF